MLCNADRISAEIIDAVLFLDLGIGYAEKLNYLRVARVSVSERCFILRLRITAIRYDDRVRLFLGRTSGKSKNTQYQHQPTFDETLNGIISVLSNTM